MPRFLPFGVTLVPLPPQFQNLRNSRSLRDVRSLNMVKPRPRSARKFLAYRSYCGDCPVYADWSLLGSLVQHQVAWPSTGHLRKRGSHSAHVTIRQTWHGRLATRLACASSTRMRTTPHASARSSTIPRSFAARACSTSSAASTTSSQLYAWLPLSF